MAPAPVGKSFTVTASTFGGPGDPGTGSTGYRGDNLNQHPDSFAELSNNPGALDFSALGGLPHGTPVTVTNPANGKSITVYKRDVGAGGAGINGTKRGIDLWYKAAQQLGINGLGVVKVTVGGAPGNTSTSTPGKQASPGGPNALPGIPTTTSTFDAAGFKDAQNRAIAGNYLQQTAANNPWNIGPKSNAGSNGPSLIGPGLLSTTPPNQADFMKSSTQLLQAAQSGLQKIAGGTVLQAHPGVAGATPKSSGLGGGFLPQGAKYVVGRKDQGRDGSTNPGGPILAPGNGYVVRVGSDPGGFGPSYPIIHFTSGPYAGRTMYLGHTLSAVQPGQKFGAGAVLSHTGTHGIGNATVPGWFEIGFADSGSPGPNGQPVPF